MAMPHTRPVRIGKYTITGHAQNRIVQPSRKLNKTSMVRNLYGRSINSPTYIRNGSKQYDRINPRNKTITHITSNNHVKTIHRVHNVRSYIKKWK